MSNRTAAGLPDVLPDFLERQRWFAGGRPDRVAVTADDELAREPAPLRRLVVDADGAVYQLIVGERPAGELPESVGPDMVIAEAAGIVTYDATVDHDLSLRLLELVSREHADTVRPVGAEQSNTSLVYDERLILKLFRRLAPGPNPEVEVAKALDDVGFNHVPETIAAWRQHGSDLAIVEEYLAGGTEGWALALTSLRDLFAAGPEPAAVDAGLADEAAPDPAASGGDFAGEAERLGSVTARLHLAMAEAFGVQSGSDDPQMIRVHGDYHLGQVMRTDQGWFILDFEGEPARPLEERRRHTSPYKDVAGMVRSFHYAAQMTARDRGEDERAALAAAADAWEQRNRAAFLAGYEGTKGIDELLPPDSDQRAARLWAWELDKARYELAYERAHRPDWAVIPEQAIERLLAEEATSG